FHHLIFGYRLESEGKPRIVGLFDYVTGDNNPNDGENNRFDTLFGARRFEFGPTGIFGAFARSNLVSPGLRFVTKLAPDWEFMATQRFHYLASDRDAWTTSGLVDPDGRSGSHIGNFSEFRVRYDIIPDSVRIEFGAAYLSAGSFIDNAPNATTQGDTLYGYFQTNFAF
ncbi:MAG: alginate export family protein, partial [Planctomycetota bacterium]